MEPPQIMSLPSFVWFESTERGLRFIPHTPYLFLKSICIFLGTLTDRESAIFAAPKLFPCPNKIEVLGQVV